MSDFTSTVLIKTGPFACPFKESTMPLTPFMIFTPIGLKPSELKQTFPRTRFIFQGILAHFESSQRLLHQTHVVVGCLCVTVVIIKHLFILKCWPGFCLQVVGVLIVPV